MLGLREPVGGEHDPLRRLRGADAMRQARNDDDAERATGLSRHGKLRSDDGRVARGAAIVRAAHYAAVVVGRRDAVVSRADAGAARSATGGFGFHSDVRKRRVRCGTDAHNPRHVTRFRHLLPRAGDARRALRRPLFRRRALDAHLLPAGLHRALAAARELPLLPQRGGGGGRGLSAVPALPARARARASRASTRRRGSRKAPSS